MTLEELYIRINTEIQNPPDPDRVDSGRIDLLFWVRDQLAYMIFADGMSGHQEREGERGQAPGKSPTQIP